jgi:hypothetical protein
MTLKKCAVGAVIIAAIAADLLLQPRVAAGWLAS